MPRTVLITGCSDGGLGAALAIAFHKHGDRVLATARNPSKMTHLKSQGIETLALDVLSEESLQAAVKEVSQLTNNSHDVLINNAGNGFAIPLLDAKISDIQDVFNLNVFSLLRTTQVFFPLLRNSQAGGLVVNNTSVASVVTVPFQIPYGASKAAAATFSDGLRLELEPFGIKVVDLKTGAVKSNFFTNTAGAGGELPKIPQSSLYQPAADKINAFLGGEGTHLVPADAWAAKIVKDLSTSRPSARIWRGGSAFMVWLSTCLPHGTLDGMIRKMSGLDVLDAKLKAQGKQKTK